MIVYIGLDDTDNLESRGTGRLARSIAGELLNDFDVLGVTRHQLLVDPRVPYTSHNSSAAILLRTEDAPPLQDIFERVRLLMEADFQAGSDPGLCVAADAAAVELTHFGQKAQYELVGQTEARSLAAQHGALLAGLGGTQDGVIGAVSAVGLAAGGEDGRYLLVGRSRDLSGLQPLAAVYQVGVTEVRTLDGLLVESGLVMADKLRPARREGRPILFVENVEDHWRPVKLD